MAKSSTSRKPTAKQEGKPETIIREIKKLVKTPHGHFMVMSNSDRVLACAICKYLFLFGAVKFKLRSWNMGKSKFKLVPNFDSED